MRGGCAVVRGSLSVRRCEGKEGERERRSVLESGFGERTFHRLLSSTDFSLSLSFHHTLALATTFYPFLLTRHALPLPSISFQHFPASLRTLDFFFPSPSFPFPAVVVVQRR